MEPVIGAAGVHEGAGRSPRPDAVRTAVKQGVTLLLPLVPLLPLLLLLPLLAMRACGVAGPGYPQIPGVLTGWATPCPS